MGVVYAARDEELDREVAIKVLQRPVGEALAAPDHVRAEARAMARLAHPHVVHVYEVGEDAGQLYLVMERVRGRTLRSWQRGRDWRRVLTVYLQAARGLAAAHRAGVVHRDFKPENVIVDEDGNARVLDFGIARLAEQAGIRPEDGAGTPRYMAPEQAADGSLVDGRADQYAFCVALEEALGAARGRPPPAVLQVAARGRAPRPDARFPGMDALAARLEAAAQERRGTSVLRWGAGAVAVALAFGAALRWGGPGQAGEGTAMTSDQPRRTGRAAAVLPTQADPVPGDPLKVTVHRFDNGLTVLLAPRYDAPRVVTRIVVRAGYGEDGDRPGLAHVVMTALAHGTHRMGTLDDAAEDSYRKRRTALMEAFGMAPAGSERTRAWEALMDAMSEVRPLWLPDEVPSLLPRLGARAYGALQDDVTRIIAEIPSTRLPVWARFEADRMQNTVLRNFPRSVAQAMQEARASAESAPPGELLLHRLLRRHAGVGFDPLAEMEFLARLPIAEAQAFYDRWYVPSNTAVVVVGDVERTAALAVLERTFGAWPEGPAPSRPTGRHVLLDGPVTAETVGPVARVDLAWPLPPADARSRRGRRLLADVLADPAGPLGGAWEVELLSYALRLSYEDPKAPLDLPAAVVERPVEILSELGRNAESVAGLLPRLELRRRRALLDADHVADELARVFAAGVAWRDVVAAAADDEGALGMLAEAARRLAASPVVTVHTRVGEPRRPRWPELPRLEPERSGTGQSAFAASLLKTPEAPMEPRFLHAGRDFEERDLGGTWVVAAPGPPGLYRLTLRYPWGLASDPYACLAAHVLRHRLRTDPGLSAADTRVRCDWGEVELRVEGLAERIDAELPRVRVVTRGAGLGRQEWDRVREEILQRRRLRRKDAEPLGRALHEVGLWGEAAGARRAPGDAEVRRLEAGAVAGALARLLALRPHVAYAGPDWRAFPDLAASAWNGRPARSPRRRFDLRGPAVEVLRLPGEERAHVQVAWFVGDISVEDRALADVYRTWLYEALYGVGRDLGTLNAMDARWRNDRTYPRGPAAFTVRFTVPAGRVARVLAAVKKLVREGPATAELARTRSTVERLYRMGGTAAQVLPSRVLRWRQEGLQGDPRISMWARIGRVSDAQLTAFARRVGRSPVRVTVATGQPPALGERGAAHRVRELRPEDLVPR